MRFMTVNISPRMFGYLCNEIDSGRPLAALLRATEYLEFDNPVFIALVQKARDDLCSKSYRVVRDIIDQLEHGLTLREMSANQRARVRNFREFGRRKKKRPVIIPHHRFRDHRQALRAKSGSL